MKYYPDKWVVVEISNQSETVRKILSSWYGGFTNGDSWRLSSGIIDFIDNFDHYIFYNESGSEYLCRKSSYGMSTYTTEIYNSWVSRKDETTSIKIVKSFDNEQSN